MHISDGVLPMQVVIGSYAVTLLIAAVSARTVTQCELPKIAVVTSSFFVASLVHVPLGPTSVHLLLPGLVGVLLGPVAFLSITLGLFLQSLLFQFGGLTAVGANALMIGLPALLCGGVFRFFAGRSHRTQVIAGAVCGTTGSLLAAFFLALFLMSAGEDFSGVAKVALLAHLPVFVVEGGVSAFTVSFLFRVRPELLRTVSSISRVSLTCHNTSKKY